MRDAGKRKVKVRALLLTFLSAVSIIKREPLMNHHLKALQVLTAMTLNLTYRHRTTASLRPLVHYRRHIRMVLAVRIHLSHRLVMRMSVLSHINVK